MVNLSVSLAGCDPNWPYNCRQVSRSGARSAEREGPVDKPQVEIQAQRAAREGLEGVHVERHRVLDDFVEKRLSQIDFALPQHPLVGLTLVPPELAAVGHGRTHICFAVLILVDQLDMSIEKPPHLVAEPRPVPQRPAAQVGPHGEPRGLGSLPQLLNNREAQEVQLRRRSPTSSPIPL